MLFTLLLTALTATSGENTHTAVRGGALAERRVCPLFPSALPHPHPPPVVPNLHPCPHPCPHPTAQVRMTSKTGDHGQEWGMTAHIHTYKEVVARCVLYFGYLL